MKLRIAFTNGVRLRPHIDVGQQSQLPVTKHRGSITIDQENNKRLSIIVTTIHNLHLFVYGGLDGYSISVLIGHMCAQPLRLGTRLDFVHQARTHEQARRSR